MRAFASDRLADAGEEQAPGRRHRDAYLARAEDVGRHMSGPGLAEWLPRGRLDHDDFDAAVRWSLARGEAGEALQLTAWLGMYWFRVGAVRQGRELLDDALAGAEVSTPHRPRALVGRAILAGAAHPADAADLAAESAAACEQAGDLELLGLALCWRARALALAGRLREAGADVERARAVLALTGDPEGLAFVEQVDGVLALQCGDLERADALLRRGRDGFRRLRGALDAGYTLVDLAHVALARGRPREAAAHAGEALADFRRREDPRGAAAALTCLGSAHAGMGDQARSRVLLTEARRLSRDWGLEAELQHAETALAALGATSAAV